jgi:hypothetical protein
VIGSFFNNDLATIECSGAFNLGINDNNINTLSLTKNYQTTFAKPQSKYLSQTAGIFLRSGFKTCNIPKDAL